MSQLTHFDSAEQTHMIDAGDRAVTHHVTVTTDTIRMLPETFALVRDDNTKKGDMLGITHAAAVQGSKRTLDLIPLYHPLALTEVAMEFSLDKASYTVRHTVQAETREQAGVEMRALTTAQVGLLTIYDMCEAVDRGMVIGDVRLLERHGGKSGD